MVELPIPDLGLAPILDLSFADLEDDGVDELLVLYEGSLVVVEDGATSSSYPVDPLADEITAVHVDDDGILDVLASSSMDGHSAVLLGVGDASLLPPLPRMFEGLQHTRALDWPSGGAGELVAMLGQNPLPVRVEQLDDPLGQVAGLGFPNFAHIEVVVDLHAGDFDGDGFDDVLALVDDQGALGVWGRARSPSSSSSTQVVGQPRPAQARASSSRPLTISTPTSKKRANEGALTSQRRRIERAVLTPGAVLGADPEPEHRQRVDACEEVGHRGGRRGPARSRRDRAVR